MTSAMSAAARLKSPSRAAFWAAFSLISSSCDRLPSTFRFFGSFFSSAFPIGRGRIGNFSGSCATTVPRHGHVRADDGRRERRRRRRNCRKPRPAGAGRGQSRGYDRRDGVRFRRLGELRGRQRGVDGGQDRNRRRRDLWGRGWLPSLRGLDRLIVHIGVEDRSNIVVQDWLDVGRGRDERVRTARRGYRRRWRRIDLVKFGRRNGPRRRPDVGRRRHERVRSLWRGAGVGGSTLSNLGGAADGGAGLNGSSASRLGVRTMREGS